MGGRSRWQSLGAAGRVSHLGASLGDLCQGPTPTSGSPFCLEDGGHQDKADTRATGDCRSVHKALCCPVLQ